MVRVYFLLTRVDVYVNHTQLQTNNATLYLALLTATETVTPVGDKTKESCAPHSLTGSTLITRIRKPRWQYLTEYITKYKQPDIKNNSCTTVDTCIHRHTWTRSGRSAGERGKQEAEAQIRPSLPRSKTLIRNKKLSDFKHRNRSYTPQQDTLHQ